MTPDINLDPIGDQTAGSRPAVPRDSEPAAGSGRSIGLWPAIELAGLVLAGGVIVLLLLGYQLVILTSASMAPSAPAGSMLIVSSTPSELVAVNDIIVMDRGGALPITHRVIELVPPLPSSESSSVHGSIGSVGSQVEVAPDQILAITQGDANRTADPRPFPMSGDQRVVRAAIPTVGWVLLVVVNHTPELLILATVMGLALAVNGLPDRTFLNLVPKTIGKIRDRSS